MCYVAGISIPHVWLLIKPCTWSCGMLSAFFSSKIMTYINIYNDNHAEHMLPTHTDDLTSH